MLRPLRMHVINALMLLRGTAFVEIDQGSEAVVDTGAHIYPDTLRCNSGDMEGQYNDNT